MKHPCMAMCEATNRTVIRGEVWEVGGAPEQKGGGRGWEGLRVVDQLSLVIWLFQRHIIVFYHPPDLDRSKLIFPLNQRLAKLMCFAYCLIAYISFGSCKDCVKEPPLSPPPPHPTSHTPLPVNYAFALWASGHGFSFFSHPPFQSYFTKEVVVVWRQC